VDVFAFDFRGHGLSPGPRGVVKHYDDLVSDFTGGLGWVRAELPNRPLFVLGHSNGAQVVLRAVLAGERFDGLILSNPAVRLAVKIPLWKRLAGEILNRVAPGVTLHTPVVDDLMTRDAESWPLRRADSLRHTRISAPLYFGMIEGGPRIVARAAEIRISTLLILGEKDSITDASASKVLFDRLGAADKTLRIFPDMLHEPLNDLGREAVYEAIVEWLSAHIARAEASRDGAVRMHA
jgi:alpha-beta hydrolase superfamily lysophospholipase